MKKLISKIMMTVFLAVILLSGSILVFAADGTAKITVEDISGNPGETVKINIGLENLPEAYVSGAQFKISYDAELLELLSVDEFCGILTGGGQGTHDLKANPYIISYGDGINVINTATSGIIASATFKISDKAKAGSTTDVKVTSDQIISMSDNADEIPVEEETVTGTVEIKKPAEVHEHVFGDWEITKEANCTEEGSKTRKCIECGYEESESVEKTDHNITDWSIQKDATCKEAGLRVKICDNCKEVFAEEVIQPKGHDLTSEIVDEPTCTAEGHSKSVCSVCGEVISEDTIPANGHTPGDWSVEKEATCTENGLRVKYCTACSEIMESEVIEAALGHTEGEWTVETEPACDVGGKKILICSKCGDVIDVEYTKPLGHSYGDWTVVKEASAEEDGLQERTCTVCGNVDQIVIPKTAHEENEHVFDGREELVIAANCTDAGVKRIYCSIEGCDAYVEETIPAEGHGAGEWTTVKEASCVEDGEEELICEFCGEKLGTRKKAALGHEYGDWLVSEEPACTVRGERSKKCAVCGQEISEFTAPTGHAFGEWKVVQEPGCTEIGRREHICEKCGVPETEAIAAVGHQEGEWVVESEATCSEAGKKVRKCSVCDEILEIELVSKKAHSVEKWEALKEPTCQEGGINEGTCVECGEKISFVTPKTGHIAGDSPVITVRPTCEKDGEQEIHCKYCDELMGTETIAALGHDYGNPVTTKEPTCSKPGEQVQTCSICENERYSEILPTGHSYGEPVVQKTATYNADGKAVRVCEICGDELLITLPRIDTAHEHDYNGLKEVVTKATCTKKGKMHVHCTDSLCDSYKTVDIPLLKHKYGAWKVTKKATYTSKGTKERKCGLCGHTEEAAVPALKRTSISKAQVSCLTSIVFNGHSLTPVPTVKLGGKTLKKGSDFGLAYKNNKNVGTATITITGKGAYQGTLKKTFKINPKPTSISKLSAGTGKVVVTWKKQASQTTGYQIQYSLRSDFKTQNAITVGDAKTITKTITGLSRKRMYYVRIRTYKTVGRTKYYSTWSASKTVKTK